MAVNRRVRTISVNTQNNPDYETDLETQWNTVTSGGDYAIAAIFKKEAGSTRESYVLFLEEVV